MLDSFQKRLGLATKNLRGEEEDRPGQVILMFMWALGMKAQAR